MGLVRFGISLEKGLLSDFDAACRQNNYQNRSEAIRDLIRESLVKRQWQKAKGEIAGVISIVYGHHKRELTERIVDTQHDYQEMIISTQHAHLSHDNCIEVIIVRGKSRGVHELASRLKSLKGVKHAELIATTTGSGIR